MSDTGNVRLFSFLEQPNSGWRCAWVRLF